VLPHADDESSFGCPSRDGPLDISERGSVLRECVFDADACHEVCL